MAFEKGDRNANLVKCYFIEADEPVEMYPVDATFATTTFPNQHSERPWTDEEKAAYAKLSDKDKAGPVFKLGPPKKPKAAEPAPAPAPAPLVPGPTVKVDTAGS